NAPVDDRVIAQMAAGLGIPIEALLAFRGRPLRAFYSEAICGGVVLRLQSAHCQERDHHAGEELAPDRVDATRNPDRPQDRAAMVPMAFQSALAGVLLAAAVVADAAGLPSPAPGEKAVLDLLRPLGTRLLVPVARHRSGK